MHLEIREARPDDADAVVRILNPIIAAGVYTVFDTAFTPDAEREYIRTLTPRGMFLVAVSQPENTVVGFQTMEPFAGYTHAFDHVGVLGTYVDLERRRRGIATRLFEETFTRALRKGYEKISRSSAPTTRPPWRPTCARGFGSSDAPTGRRALETCTSMRSSSKEC